MTVILCEENLGVPHLEVLALYAGSSLSRPKLKSNIHPSLSDLLNVDQTEPSQQFLIVSISN